MDWNVALITFPVIFLGELPDKTMFANLVMATRGRPALVWVGAAGAFVAHVVLATTVGMAIFALLPRKPLDATVAVLFLAAAGYAWWLSTRPDQGAPPPVPRRNVVLTAFVVIFVAEWGDLTQILTANLAARYHSPLPVALGAIAALWSVAGLAVLSGRTLLRFLDLATIRKVTALVLLGLAVYTAWLALR
jgi:putative Ca2+/H+ antiporter (TMEM165/GDT1 family)